MYVVAATDAPAAVKARADYVCDGTADEVQINTALALGSVQLTDGTYTIATPIVRREAGGFFEGTYYGASNTDTGRGDGTLILAASGFTGTEMIQVRNATDVSPPREQFTMGKMRVSGQGNVGRGVLWKSHQGTLHHLRLREFSGDGGLVIQGYSSSPGPQYNTFDLIIHDVQARDVPNGAGIYCLNNSTDMHMSQCVWLGNMHGMRLAGGVSIQVTGVHCYGNSDYNIWFDGSGSRAKFGLCKIEHAGKHGIFFDGTTGGTSQVQFVGCGFNCNGEATNDTYDHVNVSGTQQSGRVTFVACSFGNSDGAANLARYAIFLGSQGLYWSVVGCNFGLSNTSCGVATGKIGFSGSNAKNATTIVGNYGVNDWRGTAVPTVAAGASAGTSPPTPTVTTDSGSFKGRVSFGTGTGSPGTASLVDVTFDTNAVLQSGTRVMLTPANAATAQLNPYVQALSTTGFSIGFGTAPAASQAATVYVVDYAVAG